jgi:redox-sensitive bicupin YhaK (pirin superfamily)
MNFFLILSIFFASSLDCDEIEETCAMKFISKILSPNLQSEGDGAQVRRLIGNEELRDLDPFLMMDHFYVSPPAGFPAHPHRGFETITYMLNGTCMHEDFKGNSGEMHEGDVQWMTAGRGIVHAEMPKDGPMEGIQLWLNLPKDLKLSPAAYQELTSDSFPEYEPFGFSCKIIAGKIKTLLSPIKTKTGILFFDIKIEPLQKFSYKIPERWNSILYVLNGEVKIEDKTVKAHEAAVLSKFGTGLIIKSPANSRVLLIAGEKISEPVFQHGPFVMSSKEEIAQAIKDFRSSSNGFEGASTWRSKIAS